MQFKQKKVIMSVLCIGKWIIILLIIISTLHIYSGVPDFSMIWCSFYPTHRQAPMITANDIIIISITQVDGGLIVRFFVSETALSAETIAASLMVSSL